jgi:ATP-dependent Lon protease
MASEDLIIKHAMGEGPGESAPVGPEPPAIKPPAEEPLPDVLPVLPLGDLVVFPGMVAPLVINTQRSTKLIDDVVAGGRYLIGALQKNRAASDDQVQLADVHPESTVLRLLKMLKFPDDTVRVLVQGHARCLLGGPPSDTAGAYLRAHYKLRRDEVEDTMELQALARNASQRFQEVITLSPTLPDELKIAVVNTEDPGQLSDLIAANLNLSLEDRQALLSDVAPKSRLKRVSTLLNREREVLRLGAQIQNQVSETFGKNQREFFLREQLKAIRKELGETDPQQIELKELEEKLAKAACRPRWRRWPRRARAAGQHPSASPEYAVARTYLEILADLPWNVRTVDNLDIARARRILDEDHYGLKKVKDRILEYLSVLKLKQDMKGPILCFVGPPGVGKTSLGQSIAARWAASWSACRWAACATRPRSAATAAPTSAPCPAASSRTCARPARATRCSCWTRSTSWAPTSAATPRPRCWRCWTPRRTTPSPTTTWTCPSTCPPCCSSPPPTWPTDARPPCATAWRSSSCPATPRRRKLSIARRHLIPRQMADHGLKPGQVVLPTPRWRS